MRSVSNVFGIKAMDLVDYVKMACIKKVIKI